MKSLYRGVIVLSLLTGCQKDPLPQSENGEVKVQVTSSQVKSGIPIWGSTITSMKILVVNENQLIRDTLSIEAQTQTEENISFRLFPGHYKLFFIANASEQSEWSYNQTEGSIKMKLKSSGALYEEASDFFTDSMEINVIEEESLSATIDLHREVSTLLIKLEDIPIEISQIRFRLSGTPVEKIPGSTSQPTLGTIQKFATKANESGGSETRIKTFPTPETGRDTLSVIYSYNGVSRIKVIPLTEKLLANSITQISGRFTQGSLMTFSITHQSWSEEIFNGGTFDLQERDPEFEEEENISTNLLLNGGFEIWDQSATPPIPYNWKYDSGGTDKNATSVTENTLDGLHAVLLSGKTYLYQDVPVTPGKIYRITIHANSPSANTKWRMYSSWRSATAKLTQDENTLQPGTFSYGTPGYINPLEGKTFIAPEGAKYFRIEVRTYETAAGEGLFLDNLSVEEL